MANTGGSRRRGEVADAGRVVKPTLVFHGDDQFLKSQIIKGMVGDRYHRLRHDPPPPEFQAQPKAPVLRLAHPPQINGADHRGGILLQANNPGPVILALLWGYDVLQIIRCAIFRVRPRHMGGKLADDFVICEMPLIGRRIGQHGWPQQEAVCVKLWQGGHLS